MSRDQRGSGSLLLATTVVILLALLWVGVVGGTYAVALHRSRGAADRAALAGAVAFAQGNPACAAARAQVTLEGSAARLADCRGSGDLYQFVVSVQVEHAVSVRVPGLPSAVRATAHAGPVASAISPGSAWSGASGSASRPPEPPRPSSGGMPGPPAG